eukprot:gene10616-biopygen16801
MHRKPHKPRKPHPPASPTRPAKMHFTRVGGWAPEMVKRGVDGAGKVKNGAEGAGLADSAHLPADLSQCCKMPADLVATLVAKLTVALPALFTAPPWARFDNVDVDCASPCTVTLRMATQRGVAVRSARAWRGRQADFRGTLRRDVAMLPNPPRKIFPFSLAPGGGGKPILRIPGGGAMHHPGAAGAAAGRRRRRGG